MSKTLRKGVSISEGGLVGCHASLSLVVPRMKPSATQIFIIKPKYAMSAIVNTESSNIG